MRRRIGFHRRAVACTVTVLDSVAMFRATFATTGTELRTSTFC